MEQGTLIQSKKLSALGVAITMHLSPNYIIISLDDKTVHVFSPDGELLHVLNGHEDNVQSLALNRDTLLCGKRGGEIQSWNLVTG